MALALGLVVGPEPLRAARLLGARRLRRLLTIELPLVRPSVMAGGGLVLLFWLAEGRKPRERTFTVIDAGGRS